MPTAVLDVELSAIPVTLELSDRYDHAWVLLRWQDVPVGEIELAVRGGRIDADQLVWSLGPDSEALVSAAEVAAFLGLPGHPSRADPCTVAVCTRDRPADLARCLEALLRLPDDGQELLVIDSGSTTDSTRRIAAEYPRVRYLREERPGLDRARNRALREARHDVVLFTDDDTVPDHRWLRSMMAGLVEPRTLCVTGLTAPLELETDAQECFQRTNGFGRGYRAKRFDGAQDDPFFVARVGAGANMALRRSVLDLVGPFDEALDAGTPTRSGGDHDMFTRILRRGYCIVYQPSALSWHRHRREWAELRTTIVGYGLGVAAYLTGQLLQGESRALMVGLRWFAGQCAGLARGLVGRPGVLPPGLALAGLAGCCAGPFAYWRSRRQERRSPP